MSATADDRRAAAADLAASALLGALLWDPERIRDVADWLQPHDFRRWGDRAVYQTLVGMHNDGWTIDLMALPEVLTSGQYHDAHAQPSDGRGALSAAALHTYLAITPATPPRGQHGGSVRSEHVRYARLVLDDSIRRQVEALGCRIDQHARHVADRDSASAVETLAPVLADIQARLQQLTGRLDDGRRTGTGTPAGRGAKPAAHPSSQGSRPEPATREPPRTEYTLLGSCLVSPEVRGLAEGRLRTADFTTPEIAATWQAIRSLLRERQPIDVVLVAAEIERQGALPGIGLGLEPEQLLHLIARFEHVAPVAGYKALETVVQAAIARAVRGGGEQLHTLVGDRAQSSQELLTSAQRTVGAVESAVRRLTGTAPTTAQTAMTPSERIPASRSSRRQPHGPPPPSATPPAPAPTPRRR